MMSCFYFSQLSDCVLVTVRQGHPLRLTSAMIIAQNAPEIKQ